MNALLERLERDAGVSNLVNLLAERLTPTDLQSLLLEVYRHRTQKKQPSDVLREYETNRFVRPGLLSPSRLLLWEQFLLSRLPEGVEMLELSPVCPLGTSSVLADVDQNWSVSTARNTEVVSDATNVLALECAMRRRALLKANPKSTASFHLSSSHRLLRPQFYGDPKALAHFRLFSLCSAGRDTGNLNFEFSMLLFHLSLYLRTLQGFLDSNVRLNLTVSDFSDKALATRMEQEIFAPLRLEVKNLECNLDPERVGGRGYYNTLCFKIHAVIPDGSRLELADGGVVDWTQKLLSNAKERLFISGLSSERVCMMQGVSQ
jgi:hypothetical protein